MLVHVFHKNRRPNPQPAKPQPAKPQPAKPKIKSTLLNIEAKVIQKKNKKQYDVILCITRIQYKNRSTI